MNKTIPYLTNFPDVGITPQMDINVKMIVWGIMLIILIALTVFFIVTRKNKLNKKNENKK